MTPNYPRRNSARKWTIVAVALVGLLAAGCKVGPNYKTPEPPVAGGFMAVNGRTVDAAPANPKQWWKVFNDPVLDSLIDQAYRQNLGLQEAGLRLIQARLARANSVWAFFPVTVVSGDAAHHHYSTTVKPQTTFKKGDVEFNHRLGDALAKLIGKNVDVTLPELKVTPEMDLYRAGLDAVWEMDVWGKYRRNYEVQNADLQAALGEYDAVLVSLTGEVAMTYIEIRTLQQRIATARDNIATLQSVLITAQRREREGKATGLDQNLAKTLLCNEQASIPPLEAALKESENGLCVLLGKQPYEIEKEIGTGEIPLPPDGVAIGAPAELLRRRPDLRMAERQAAAESARVGLAKSALYPSFSLMGGIGLSSSHSDKFFRGDSGRGYYGGLFTWNILIYPVLQDLVRSQDAQFQQSVLNYKNTVLTAAQEVESAATAFTKAQERIPMLEDSVDASRAAVNLSTGQYQRGKVDFSTVTDALNFYLQGTANLIDADGQAAMALVATYKALGGGWEIREGQEVIPEDIKAKMRKDTDWWTFEGPKLLRTNQLTGPEQ